MTTPAAEPPNPSQPARILVVEDESIVARDLRQQLVALGYLPVADVRRGEDALQLVETLRPDLVLMDVRLAGVMDGITAARVVRERFAVPVVFLTAFTDDEMLERAKLAEPFGYVMKPFEVRELRTAVEMALYKHAAEERLRQEREEQAAIVRAAMDGFCLLDLTGRILEVNEAFCALNGYGREELLQMTMRELTAPDSPCDLEELIADIRRRGVTRCERRHRCKDGRVIDVEVSVNFRPTAGGRLFCFVRDITERKQAEAAVRLSEERFRRLLQNVSAVAVQGYALDGTTQYWNAASEHLYGYPAAEAIGRNVLELVVPPELRAEVVAALRTAAATGVPPRAAELMLRRKDGSRVAVFSSQAVVQVPGRPAELFAIHVDLSERRRAEQALRESEAKFARAFQSSPVAMAISSLEDGTFIEVNETFLRVSGFAREEVIGRGSVDVGWVAREDRDGLVKQLLTAGRVKNAELTMRGRDGRAIHALYSGELVEIGGQPRVLSTWQDVTRHREAESLLRLQSSALEAAANAIVITDRAGVVEWANPAFTAVTGYERGEAVGRRLGELLKSGEHPPAFYAELWQTILSGRVWHGEITNRRKDGARYTEDMMITPVKDPAGAISHFIAVKQDITERRGLEERFRQAQKMEAIGQLAGGVAHDFNNILAAVLMYLGLLQDEPAMDAHTRRNLKEVEKEVQRGATLTRQLLTFSRQQAMDPRVVRLDDVLAGLMKMLRRLLGEDIAVVVQGAPELPVIEADVGMLEQVITNLCVNARDAMPRGGQLVLRTGTANLAGADAAGRGRAGRFVRLEVSDTGCGMDEKTQQRLFEPFFTTKPVGRGTGLGLATAYGIVQQHRGWITVDSAVGRGTTFSIFLPVAERPDPADTEAEAARPARGRGEAILVVEDEANVRTVVTAALQRHGYEVVEAASGPEAIQRWQDREGAFELLLTDMVMPGGMTGRELAERLAAEKPRLRVILCTGYSQQLLTGSELAGRATVLRKPFGAARLLAVVRRTLDAG